MDTGTEPTRRGPYAKSAARRAEIIDAAIATFGEKGYHGTSMREISRAMGMSLTAVTHHFPTKSALLEAVLEATGSEAALVDASGGVVAWLGRIVERNTRRSELVRVRAIVAAEASAPDHPAHDWMVQHYRSLRETLTGLIVEDQGAGLLPEALDPRALADELIALMDGLQLQWLIDPSVDMHGHFLRSVAVLTAEPPRGRA